MSIEIERKFLVKGDYKSHAFSHSHIEQGYIPCAPGRTVRVRIRNEKAYLTIKGKSDKAGLSRYEFETEIPLDEAHNLMNLCAPGRIDKVRWLVKSGEHTFEVDEFFGDNEGLVVAEVELQSEDEVFVRPDFLGEEVTGDRKYYNSHLMNRPYSTWSESEKQIPPFLKMKK